MGETKKMSTVESKGITGSVAIQEKLVELWSSIPQIFKIDPKIYTWKPEVSVDFDYTSFGWTKYKGIVIPVALHIKSLNSVGKYRFYFETLFKQRGEAGYNCHEFAKRFHLSDEEFGRYLIGGSPDADLQLTRHLSKILADIDKRVIPDYKFNSLVFSSDFYHLRLTRKEQNLIRKQSQKVAWPDFNFKKRKAVN